MRLLVTGGCGFIGSNFIRHVLEARPGWSVVNLDALTYAGSETTLADLHESGGGGPGAPASPDATATTTAAAGPGPRPPAARYRLVVGDVCDAAAVEPLVAGCDAVVHFAAQTHVDRSIADARPFVLTNVLGTQVLIDALRRAGPADARRLVHISTDEVYGDLPLDEPGRRFSEDSPLRPNSPYAASKAAADHLVLAACHTHGLDAVITRGSNTFGPWQHPEKVIPLFITHLFEGRKVPLYGDGSNVRDWIHVDDHCRAILAALERGGPSRGGSSRIYNVASGIEWSNLELTRTLLSIVGQDERMIEHVPDRPGHDRRYAMDTTLARAELAWQPQHTDLRQALARTVAWYRDHAAWWGPLKVAGDPINPPAR